MKERTHAKASERPYQTLQDGFEDVLSLLDFASEIGGNDAKGRALLAVVE